MASKPAKKSAPAKKKKAATEKAVETPQTGLKFLNVGCGLTHKENTTKGFNIPEWHEVRLDIEKSVAPDIVADMADMSAIEANSFDALFSQHSIQHLHIHEVPRAFAEFLRVLKPEGFAVISCPDLQSTCALVAQNKLTASLYNSPAGPITPLDILYGHRASIANGQTHMAHHCGFTKDILGGTLAAAGFVAIAARQRAHPHYDLWVIATKSKIEKPQLEKLVAEHFPA